MTCPCCGHKTRAAYDEQEIPASPFGPRLMSIVALLTGVYHVSRRNAAKLLSDHATRVTAMKSAEAVIRAGFAR